MIRRAGRAIPAAAGDEPAAVTLSLALGGGTLAPVRARAALGALRSDIDPEQLALLHLLISELVTNSVIHGRAGRDDQIVMQITVHAQLVHGAVSDSGPGFNASDPPQPRENGGLGLLIIDRSTRRWGTSNDGRRVWFELNRYDHDGQPQPTAPRPPTGPQHAAALTRLERTATTRPRSYDTLRTTIDALIDDGADITQLEHAIDMFAISGEERSALWLWANHRIATNL